MKPVIGEDKSGLPARETGVRQPRKLFRRRAFWIPVAALCTSSLLYLWLPFRVGVVQVFFRLGGSRLQVPAEYRALNGGEFVAGRSGYPADVQVLAFGLGPQARGVPLTRLAWHLIMNERLGEDNIAITLCAVTDAAIVYRSQCMGHALTFEPARVARNNLVMRDRETHSDWQQFTGEAISGPLRGCQLERVPAARMSIEEFGRRFPEGEILKASQSEQDKSAPNDQCPVMSHFAREPFLLETPGHEDPRLPRKQRVRGWWAPDGRPMACSRGAVPAPSGASRGVRDESIDCYWFAWVEFHPDTLLTSRCDG